MVKKKMPDVRPVRVFTSEYMPKFPQLKQLIPELALERSFQFINHPPGEDLVAAYDIADLFVFPSPYQGFGLPVVEAMACGTPVVCSNTSSLPEVVAEATVTVDPCDVEALAAAMHRVLADEDLQQDLSRRGLERAAGFTWERTARRTLEVYRELVSVEE